MARHGVEINLGYNPDYKEKNVSHLFEDDSPTFLQLVWGQLFISFYNMVQMCGKGSGKTWFWGRVVAFISSEEGWLD